MSREPTVSVRKRSNCSETSRIDYNNDQLNDENKVAASRVALGIEYDGTAYSGWQEQPHAPSVQQEINSALAYVADEPARCVGAGRTDAGVHASGQVAHFDAPVQRSRRGWLMGLNSRLPDDINILWVQPVINDFHARFSAVSRAYSYEILNRPVRSALVRNRSWWLYQALDTQSMQKAADYLLGEHDFSAFRASACQAHSPIRTVTQLDVVPSKTGRIVIHCRANAFLHHMVRNIVGSLVRVGAGEAKPAWMAELLAARDRKLSGITAPAHGLTLTDVEYPPELLDRAAIESSG